MKFLTVILLSLVMTLSYGLSCSEEGFREYVAQYPFKSGELKDNDYEYRIDSLCDVDLT